MGLFAKMESSFIAKTVENNLNTDKLLRASTLFVNASRIKKRGFIDTHTSVVTTEVGQSKRKKIVQNK